MMQISVSIDTYEFDLGGYSKSMQQAVVVQMRNAARAFLRAALVRIPVQSGMAKGTFLNIGRFLKVAVPIEPTVFGRKYRDRNLTAPIPKTPASGASLSMPVSDMFQVEGNIFTFQFSQDVLHYNINEFTGGHAPSAPWQSYEAGRRAFLSYWQKKGVKRLPTIYEFMIKSTVTVNGTKIEKSRKQLLNPRPQIEDS